MTRTKPILFGENFTNERSFKKADPAIYSQLQGIIGYGFNLIIYLGSSPEDDAQILANLKKTPLPAARNFGRYSNHTETPSYSSDALSKAQVEFLASKYGYSQSFQAVLPSIIRNYQYGSKNGDEVSLVSGAMLNEFLNEADEERTYGDFLEEKWDEIYDRYAVGDFTEYPWTANVFKDTENQGILTFRPRLSKSVQKILEALTLAEVRLILATKEVRYNVSHASFATKLVNILAVAKGGKNTGVPTHHVINRFYGAFGRAESLLSDGSSINLQNVNRVFTVDVLAEISITSEREKVSSDRIFSDKAKIYADFLFDNAEQFNIYEMFFAIVPVVHPRWFARSGTKEEILDFFLAVLKKYDEDAAVDIFKMIGESGATYDGELPTLNQWNKALELGTLDIIIDAAITMVMVSASDKVVPKNSKQILLRRAFGSDK